MKNAVGKDDKDINGDIVGGVNIGEARKQKAREGEEARQAEEDRYKQSAKDLAAMKNTAARTDHDLLDDPSRRTRRERGDTTWESGGRGDCGASFSHGRSRQNGEHSARTERGATSGGSAWPPGTARAEDGGVVVASCAASPA